MNICPRVTVFTLFLSFVVLQEGAGFQLPPQKEDEAAPEENQGFSDLFFYDYLQIVSNYFC
jgi:hypothetical protein